MSVQPGAALDRCYQAADIRNTVRAWMQSRGVLEVQTPALSRYAVTDPNLHSLSVSDGLSDSIRYLHTSPEFAMKRLLSVWSSADQRLPDIYQLARVFRGEERGRYHASEFTLLEWYRVGVDHLDLIKDVEALLQGLWSSNDRVWQPFDILSYGEVIRQQLGYWPESVSPQQIATHFTQAGRSFPSAFLQDADAALGLFVDEFVLPEFRTDRITVLKDYPASQSALAKLGKDKHGRTVAERFELYFGPVELGNAFHELTDPYEQRQRFTRDLDLRVSRGLQTAPVDTDFLDALQRGLPACAGIAIGMERLQMVLFDHDHIRDVVCFDDV